MPTTRQQLEALAPYALAGEHHDHKPTPCPACGREWERRTGAPGATAPKPGHLCICAWCQTVCRYTPDLQAAAVSTEELRQLPPAVRLKLESLQHTLRLCSQLTPEER